MLLPCFLWAQGPGGGAAGGSGVAERPPGPRNGPPVSPKMYEDIEIMRRLLERDLRGIYGISSFAHGAAWADYDGDGFVDLFVSNNGGLGGGRLYSSAGDGKFADVTGQANLFLGQRFQDPHGGVHL